MTAPVNPTTKELEEKAIDLGRELARQVFKKRGNHSEAHLSEVELAAICAVAAKKGMAAAMLTIRERSPWPAGGGDELA